MNPQKKFHLVFSLLMGAMMIFVMTFVITLVNVGYSEAFLRNWMKAFAIAYFVGVPVIFFHNDPAALATVPAMAERLHQATDATRPALEVYVFGPAEGALSAPDRLEFNARIDGLVKLGVRVTTCIGLAQQAGAEAAFRARGLVLESAAVAFPRFAAEAATVITF